MFADRARETQTRVRNGEETDPKSREQPLLWTGGKDQSPDRLRR